MTVKTFRRKSPGWWFRLHVGRCPHCGRERRVRERMPGRRAKGASGRLALLPDARAYCGCMEGGVRC